MEASEKTQLQFDQPDHGTVRALDDRILIQSLTVADERAAALVRERQQAGKPATETVRRAIEIGARVLDREDTAAEVEWVRNEVREELGGLGKALGETIDGGSEQLAEQLAKAFGAERNDSVQAQIKEIVAAAAAEQQQQIVKTLTAEDMSNPLVGVQARLSKAMLEAEQRHRVEVEKLREQHSKASLAMQGQVGELRTELHRLLEREAGEEAVAEAEAAGTRKGLGFEERVFAAVEEIAAQRGDAATHTGGELAEGGGKKGDVLVEIGACAGASQGRIVFEVKDKKLSKNAAWSELNEAMAARAASFGVLVVAGEDRVPSGREQLAEYEGNKLIVAVDRDEPEGMGLSLAYRLAAARLAMARDRDLKVDAPAVRDAAEEAVSTLKQAQAIRTSLTGIKTSSDKARSMLDAMVAALELKLERIDSLVAEADEAASGDAA
ncbi:hypothetical protein HJD18_05685 [Thermoleophilia bacterium SCSIO 60948]|nr:hypothetical protein HJD18_05685 [Thermoleophilia bacterium SCSIO 60948]